MFILILSIADLDPDANSIVHDADLPSVGTPTRKQKGEIEVGYDVGTC